MKICKRCGVSRPKAEFSRSKGERDGLQRWCKPCNRVERVRFREANPERYAAYYRAWRKANNTSEVLRKRNLKYNYGITSEQWEDMFELQGRKCAICASATTRGPGWMTDHDHTTGRVRGVLCHDCNISLGGYERLMPHLSRVTAYLATSGACQCLGIAACWCA
jgi:hypothetical protein